MPSLRLPAERLRALKPTGLGIPQAGLRPTLRAAGLVGAGFPLTLAVLLAGDGLWPLGVGYFTLAIILIGADALILASGRALTAEVSTPSLLYIGDRDPLKVELRLAAGSPAVAIDVLCDLSPDLAPPPLRKTRLRPGQTGSLSFDLVPSRRGEAWLHRLWLRWRSPWGLVAGQRVDDLNRMIPVVPNTRAVGVAAIRFWSRDALFGVKPQSQQGDGSEFECLRDYVPGFDHRSIDWKQSARHRRMVCKEFRAERNHQIVLAFDTGHLMGEPLAGISKLDHAINAGLLLGYLSLRSGDHVGVFGFDAKPGTNLPASGGLQHFSRLQLATAELESGPAETNFTLGLADLRTRLKRRSLVILQTEFVDTVTAELMVENLARMARRHLVILVTLEDSGLRSAVDGAPNSLGRLARSVIANDMIRERQIVLERLRRLGVHCLNAPVERIGVDLVNRYLEIRRRELI